MIPTMAELRTAWSWIGQSPTYPRLGEEPQYNSGKAPGGFRKVGRSVWEPKHKVEQTVVPYPTPSDG